MFHEMVDSTWTTTEVPLQAGSHNTPAKTWTVTHCIVGVAHTQYTVLNQIHDLFVECGLESIPYVTRKFFVQKNRLLSNPRIERDCCLNCFRRSLRSANYFYQRNDVW